MPSSVVREFDFILKRHYLEANEFDFVHQKHPLRRFNLPYFSGDTRMVSVHPEAEKEARVSIGGHEPFVPEMELDAPHLVGESKSMRRLTVQQLRRFLQNPLQGSAEYLLGLSGFEEQDVFLSDNEYFDTPHAKALEMQRDVFLEAWVDSRSIPEEFEQPMLRRIRLDELAGRIPTGVFLESECLRLFRQMKRWASNLDLLEVSGRESPAVFNFGASEERRAVAKFCEPMRVESPDATVEILGASSLVLLDQRVSLSLNLRTDFFRFGREIDFFNAFVDLMILLAQGVVEPGPWRLVQNGADTASSDNIRYLESISRERAKQWVETVVHSLLAGSHFSWMPGDSVLEYRLRTGRKAKPFKSCVRSSRLRFGPVPDGENERLYPVPSGSELESMIDSRFGLYLAHVTRG